MIRFTLNGLALQAGLVLTKIEFAAVAAIEGDTAMLSLDLGQVDRVPRRAETRGTARRG